MSRPTKEKETWREKIARLSNYLFPERELILRTDGRLTYVRFTQRLQLSAVFVLFAFLGWTAFGSFSYVLHDKIVEAKDHQIAGARLAYRSLLSEVSEYQKKFNSITDDLEENHSLMLGLVEQNASLQQSLKSVETQLKTTEKERASVISTRERLKADLSKIENEMRSLAGRNFSLKGNLNSVESNLETVISERNKALMEGTQMRRDLLLLENRLIELQASERDVVQQLGERASSFISSMEKIISLTGLNVGHLIDAETGLPKGQGGPFIEANPDGLPADMLKVNLTTLDSQLSHSGALQDILARLPLAAPLDSFYITSGYGKRQDPLNKKWASHYGVDLGGPFKSPVFSPAAGKVVKAGWNGRYGKFVEINHGAGISTRYGHLHKVLVKKGQKIDFRTKIGLLGNTGRSTGAHLHYEILFKNKSQNPLKFIKAGRHVFKE
ncbi:MAG: peptidoglycan DD-metalloendopeptidase family protein [Rhodospirillales bacterium]|nr:peptidoglycan DD-metalloendopeptidase family protein [Rhodospirillales bacterium]